MTDQLLQREQWIARPIDQVFEFFADAANLELLTPPWLGFNILTPAPLQMAVGARIAYSIRWHFISMRWLTEIVEWNPPHSFVDLQLRGPYSLWHHRHAFVADDGGTRMLDTVRYRLPLGPLGRIAHRYKVRRDLEAIFDYREQCLAEIFEAAAPAANKTLAATSARRSIPALPLGDV